VDQVVKGDVNQDAHNDWDAPAAMRGPAVSQHGAESRSQAGEPQRAEPPMDRVVGDIPRQPSSFQFRPHLMEALNRPGRGVSVLTGPPGVGKTQLAAAYAQEKLAEDWRLVAWVNAGDSGSLLAGLASVAEAAGLSEDPGWDSGDAGLVVRHWLEADGDRCLLVFDDAEDHDALRPFIPAEGAARVLITPTQPPGAELRSTRSTRTRL
jgi:hypothetical protein